MFAALEATAGRLADVDPRLLFAALALQAGSILLHGLAWRNALAAAHPDSDVGSTELIGCFAVGTALNCILPAKGGDVTKVVLARSRIDGSGAPAIVGALSLVNLFDMAVTAILTALLLQFGVLGIERSVLLRGPVATIAAAVAAVLVSVTVAAARSARLRDRLRRLAEGLLAGAAVARTPGRYLRNVVAPQLVAWICRLGVAGCMLAAFGLHTGLRAAAVVIAARTLAGLVPVGMGGLGTQQIALVYALGGSASTSQIVAFALGMQVAIATLHLLLGLCGAMVVLRSAHPVRVFGVARMLLRPRPA
jgi:uncharacterized membrane protein YbhN (UPF0104 family)